MTVAHQGPAAPRDHRLGRRRQVDARSAGSSSTRAQLFDDQLDAVVARQRAPRRRRPRPQLRHRRPARRARAGHHHRRRLPLRRDAHAQVHHRRLPGSRAVHAQHGDRCVDGRPGAGRRRRGARAQGADPPAPRASPRCWACARLIVAANKMDLADWSSSAYQACVDDVTTLAERPGLRVGDGRADLGAARRQRRRAVGEHPLVRRADGARRARGVAGRGLGGRRERVAPAGAVGPAPGRRRADATPAWSTARRWPRATR